MWPYFRNQIIKSYTHTHKNKQTNKQKNPPLYSKIWESGYGILEVTVDDVLKNLIPYLAK